MLLRKKIPLSIISLVSIPLMLLSVIVYIYTSNTLIEISKNRIRAISAIENENLNNIIESQLREVTLLSKMNKMRDVLITSKDQGIGSVDEQVRKDAEDILENTLVESSDFDNVFLADRHGRILLSANPDLIGTFIKNEEYFIEVMEAKTVISDSRYNHDGEEKIVVMAVPVQGSVGEVIGLFGSTIKLQYFQNKIANVEMSNHGYAYIVDSEGVIIAHPDAARIGTYVENEAIQSVVKKLHNKEEILEREGRYVYQGREKYMAYGIIPDINWMIVFAQDRLEMSRPALLVLLLIIVTTLMCITIAAIISIKFSKSITEPISELTETMDKAANGDLTSTCKFESQDEFGQLSRNFNVMLSQLNLSYEELTSVYEELAATEEELRAQYEELQVNEEYLRKSEEKYKLAIEGANDVIWEWDYRKKDFNVSNKWYGMTGDDSGEKISLKTIVKRIHPNDVKRVIATMRQHLEGHTDYYKSEFRIRMQDGSYKWLLTRGKALRDIKGEVTKVAGSMTDISERKETEHRIKYMAYYDTLTKLPNRVLFMEKLEVELKKAKDQPIAGAVMLIDLDNFKNVNDTLGHDYGDALLGLIAQKLKEIVKNKDTVCRFGGDEFLVLKPDIKNEEQVAIFAKKLLGIFENAFVVQDKLIYTTASIGISIYHKDGEHTHNILKNADTAMYTAKSSGKNRYAFFNDEMYQGLKRKTKIETILRSALTNNAFEVYYQPQINVKQNKMTGFEALLRLKSEEMGFISPKEFIPIAEECGLIKEIGEWCLRTACLKNKEWRDKGYEFDGIAVNISSVQFQQSNFINMITDILKETELEPQYLEIEITETVLMKSLEKNVSILESLRAIGIKIALDDFGTGYSSFNYLRRLPIHTLKIDKSFIDHICSSSKEQAIAYGIIQLAHEMKLEVVAEGVEDEYQLTILQRKECDKVQGYLFSRPLTASDAEILLQQVTEKDEVYQEVD
ncbi:MAG: sensor-containing diguanylate cyclase/phosphodiesterase [Clostridia bacterium]|jgi:diguanylate cyclase (GGDEF)-like protein/PAS domain S-box-containing protein|nr:sensor-containing diguanylate cyclase/phosphodiesterase [Clostridia bacterium]